MTIQNREAAIKETLKWEGGYTNHPSDPGGPTNWGITIIDAQKYWKKNADAADVKAMPLDIAVDIYRSKYWKTPYYDCDKLAAGVDLAVFDFGVNSGPSRAKKFLDKAIGGTSEQTIHNLCDVRLYWLQTLKTWDVFGVGWKRRVLGIKAKALQMAAAPITKTSVPSTTASKNVDRTAIGTASVAAGYAAWLKWGFIGAGIVGAVGVAAWIAYEIYMSKQNGKDKKKKLSK